MPSLTGIDLGAKVVAKLTRRLLPFLFLLYIVAYLDRINVGFAALQMKGQLGFSDEVYGLGAGIFFAGYFFFQVPSNLALARVGARKWIAVIMVVWGIISASMIFVATPRGFYLLRFLLGAAEAGFFPGMILYLRRWFPSAARARAVALFMTAAPLAGVIGGPISGLLLGVQGGHLMGWQWLFLIEGLPAVLLGGVVLAYLTDRPEIATWLTEEERAWLVAQLAREETPHPRASSACFRGIYQRQSLDAGGGVSGGDHCRLWNWSLAAQPAAQRFGHQQLRGRIAFRDSVPGNHGGHGAGGHSLRSHAGEEVASGRVGVRVRDRFRLRRLLHFDHRGRRLSQRDLDGGIFHEWAVLGHHHGNVERDFGRRRHRPDQFFWQSGRISRALHHRTDAHLDGKLSRRSAGGRRAAGRERSAGASGVR